MNSPIKILFVEDEPDIRFVVELALKRTDEFVLTSFDNPIDALEHMSGAQNDFDVLVTDVQLPGLSGTQFVREVQNLPSFDALPVIFMTGSAETEDLLNMKLANIIGVIPKPFDAIKLPAQIRALLGRG